MSKIASNPYVLDTLPAASAAYSLRRLKSTYTGSLIEVRRSSDNATQDIGYDVNGNLDTTALLLFVGANNGFVSKWYDQSGSGLTAANATASGQPQIVTSGSVNTQNAKPTVSYVSSDVLSTVAQTTLASGTTSGTLNVVAKSNAAANTDTVSYGTAASNQARALGMAASGALQYLTHANDITTGFTPSPITSPFVQTGVFTQSLLSAFANGAAVNTKAIAMNTASNTVLRLGAYAGGANFWSGNIQEVIIFNSALSTGDRNTLELNQGSFYSITVSS